MKHKKISLLLLGALLCAAQLVGMDNPQEGQNNNNIKKSDTKRKRSDSDDELNQASPKHLKLNEHELGQDEIIMTEVKTQPRFAWEDEEANFVSNHDNQDMINTYDYGQNIINFEERNYNNSNIIDRENEHDLVEKAKELVSQANITQPMSDGLRTFQIRPTTAPLYDILLNQEIGSLRAGSLNYLHTENSFRPLLSLSKYFPECMLHETIKIEPINDNFYNSLVLLDNGDFAGIRDGGIEILDGDTYAAISFISIAPSNPITVFIQLKNGKLAIGSNDGIIRIWDRGLECCVQELTGHTDVISCLLQLDNGLLASGSYDKTIKIWDLENPARPQATLKHIDMVIALTQISSCCLVSSTPKVLHFWNILGDIGNFKKYKTFYAKKVRKEVSNIKTTRSGSFITISPDDTNIIHYDFNIVLAYPAQGTNLNQIRIPGTEKVNDFIQLTNTNIALCGQNEIGIFSQENAWYLKNEIMISNPNAHGFYALMELADGNLIAASDEGLKIIRLFPRNLLIEEVALIVHLHRHRESSEKITLHADWYAVFLTLPEEFQRPFLNRINQ